MSGVAETKGLAPAQVFLGGRVTLRPGDCRDVLRTLADNSIDSIVTDPPYALVSIGKRFGKDGAAPAKFGKDGAYARASAGFMGKSWDVGETAFAVEFWSECLRVLKPGGHVAAFSGTRTYHRLAVAIEDAGFEIRDQLAWVYGAGFPKSHNVGKAIDKAAGAELGKRRIAASDLKNPPNLVGGAIKGDDRPWREEAMRVGYHEVDDNTPATPQALQWQGWGTALKPSWEPICLARKPLIGTVAENVLEHGTGALNIDGCRVGDEDMPTTASTGVLVSSNGSMAGGNSGIVAAGTKSGRWPANLVHDGSDEVVSCFPDTTSGTYSGKRNEPKTNGVYGSFALQDERGHVGDSGSAARFFYSAKADKLDRIGSKHPTVKPVDLMQWLCRLITPPGGTVLDPFAGSGSTGEAAWREGFSAVLVEREAEYQADIAERLRLADKGPVERKQRAIRQAQDAGPLFGDNDNAPQGGGGDGSTGSSRINRRTIGPIGLKR